MILELVDETRLLIILSPEDMEDYELTFDSLDWRDGHSRTVIKEFLEIACHQKGFCPEGNRLLIEAVPDEEGCVLLVTMLPDDEKKRKRFRFKSNHPVLTPFLFKFDGAEPMLSALERSFRQFYQPKGAACASELYLFGKQYFLIVYGGDSIPCPIEIILTEYGRFSGKGRQIISPVLEHGTLLSDNAICRVGAGLSKARRS